MISRDDAFAEEKKVVEDKFLKLSDMEKFLDRADAEDAGIAEDDDDDDAEALSEDDEEDDEEDLEVNCHSCMSIPQYFIFYIGTSNTNLIMRIFRRCTTCSQCLWLLL